MAHLTPAQIHAKYLASRVLSSLSGGISKSLDSFSGWMLSGFGAGFALLLTNINSVSDHVSVRTLRCGFKVFLVAVVVGALAKYIGAIVIAAASAAESAAIMTKEQMADGAEPDVTVVIKEIERAVFWPSRKLVSWSFSKISSGDLAFGGRLNAKLSQIHAMLVLVELILVLASAGVVVVRLTA